MVSRYGGGSLSGRWRIAALPPPLQESTGRREQFLHEHLGRTTPWSPFLSRVVCSKSAQLISDVPLSDESILGTSRLDGRHPGVPSLAELCARRAHNPSPMSPSATKAVSAQIGVQVCVVLQQELAYCQRSKWLVLMAIAGSCAAVMS
ncbi:unnamed protein product [Heligmosomoides polygyrus]|uniref:Uncharacterized protein n=1 Tax=Heligmosomoides polygyrus TaxID=6339 RepID=A0A183FUK4_HELPZ|nr:unnamed protein product [Heligmosomoides polygyrus]